MQFFLPGLCWVRLLLNFPSSLECIFIYGRRAPVGRSRERKNRGGAHVTGRPVSRNHQIQNKRLSAGICWAHTHFVSVSLVNSLSKSAVRLSGQLSPCPFLKQVDLARGSWPHQVMAGWVRAQCQNSEAVMPCLQVRGRTGEGAQPSAVPQKWRNKDKSAGSRQLPDLGQSRKRSEGENSEGRRRLQFKVEQGNVTALTCRKIQIDKTVLYSSIKIIVLLPFRNDLLWCLDYMV